MSRARRWWAGAAAAAALVAIAGCGESNGAGGVVASPADSELAGRVFVTTGDIGVPGGGQVVLEFTDDGRLLANAGCNSASGPVDVSDGSIVAGDLAVTEMGCPPELAAADAWLLELLGSEPEWELRDESTLVITSGEQVIAMVDRAVAEPPAPLAGTRWDVDTLISGELVESVPEAVDAYLTFDGEGGIAGQTGCNGFGGTAEITDSSVVISDVLSTLIACEGGQARVEAAMLGLLDGPLTVEITGDQLTLTAESGAGLQARVGAP
jgi:heat shock protein HslJ